VHGKANVNILDAHTEKTRTKPWKWVPTTNLITC